MLYNRDFGRFFYHTWDGTNPSPYHDTRELLWEISARETRLTDWPDRCPILLICTRTLCNVEVE